MKPARRNPAARAAFFANKAAIEQALLGGALMREVFDTFSIPCSYMQFTRYVAKHLPAVKTGGETPAQPAAAALPGLVVQAPPPRPPEPPQIRPKRLAPAKVEPWDPANLDPAKLVGRKEDT